MEICTVDGVVCFARWLVRANIKGETSYHVTEDGVFCYTENELSALKKQLDSEGEKYTVEELPLPKEAEKCKGIKYRSRSEALAHITEDSQPESMVLPDLMYRLSQVEQRARQTEKEVSEMKESP